MTDLIIGAGITGLSYAAFTNNDYIVIEADAEIGGYCKTLKKDGFVWDYSGHFFHFQDDKIKDFVMDGMNDTVLKVNKHTQIFYKNRLIDYPFQKNIHQLPKQDFIDCLYDLYYNPYQDCSTFKHMLYAKFGKSITEKFLIPYNEKLYACDLDYLDVNAMGRFFPYADLDEIIKNFKLLDESSYNAYFLYPKGGAIEYVNRIYNKLNKDSVYLNEKLLFLDVENKIVYTNNRKIKYDNLISTIPFPKLMDLVGINYDRSIYTSNKVLVLNLGFDKKGTEKINHWIYYPSDDYIFYRVGFYDNIFNSDRLSAYVEIGFKEDDEIDENYCLNRVLEDFKSIGLITDNHKLIAKQTLIMDPAYVHVTDKMEKNRDVLMKRLSSLDIYSIGRYGGWKYCSIEDNIKDALELSLITQK